METISEEKNISKVNQIISDHNLPLEETLRYLSEIELNLSFKNELSSSEKVQVDNLLLVTSLATGEISLKYPLFLLQEKPKKEVPVFEIQKYRNIFKGTKKYAMGDKKACITKMQKWLEDNPEYNFEQVCIAAHNYIDSFNGNYTYSMRADYFIYKRGPDGVTFSQLSAVIDDSENGLTSINWKQIV